MHRFSMTHLSDGVLDRDLGVTVAQDLTTTAKMLAQLGEYDSRRLYVPAGYPSMYEFCMGRFRMSEDVAIKRMKAARAAHKCPAIYSLVEDGRLTLSAVVLLAPHVKVGTSEELLEAAAHKTNAGIELLLAHRFPKADVPTTLQPIALACGQVAVRPVEPPPGSSVPGPQPESVDLLAAPAKSAHDDLLAARPVDVTTPEPLPASLNAKSEQPAQRARIKPLSPQRFALQVTIEQETHDLLREAQALLGHSVPSGDVNQVLRLALSDLVQRLSKRKFGETSRPRTAVKRRHASNERRIPAAVRREVAQRDRGQCTFVSERGHRCESRSQLEYDHIDPIARGGLSTTANLRLRCRAHNQHAADEVFGPRFMKHKREATRERIANARLP